MYLINKDKMEGNKELYVMIVSVLGGLFCILASIFNWNYFFESRKASFMVSILSRKGARIFYSLLGLGLFILAYKIYSAS